MDITRVVVLLTKLTLNKSLTINKQVVTKDLRF